MSLKRINEVLNSKQRKIQWSVQNTFTNRDSPLFCDKCNYRLGLLHTLAQSIFKKKGERYYVVCNGCRYVNVRVKGEMSKRIDGDWDKYGV